MADTPHSPGPRVVRLSVGRPATTILSAVVLGGALLVGGGAASGPPPSAGATASPTTSAATSAAGLPEDWDVTQRDLLVGQRREGALAFAQVLATRLGAPLLTTGAAPGSRGTGVASLTGPLQVPDVLWSAYRSAASSVPTSCHLPVGLLAAIGQVESGSLAGRGLDSSHRAVPAVLGPVLDGHGYAAIPDTDGGRWDHDTTWDRAVGPMQFIPSTWSRWGRDGNGDGSRDPQNVEDSAWSAAAYLCAGGRDLATSAGLRSAILSYNHSAAYLGDVLRLAGTMAPGGALPSVAAAPAWEARAFVGPPSRPPVVAAAGSGDPLTPTTTGSPTTATTRPPTTSTTSTGSSTTTTSPPLPSSSTTTSPTASSTTASPTTSTPTTTTPTTPTTTTPSPTTCPGTTTTSPTTTSVPSTTTSPTTTTTTSSSTASPSTTTDPCATTSSSTTSSGTSAPASTTTTATTTSTEGPTPG